MNEQIILEVTNFSKHFKVGGFGKTGILHASDNLNFSVNESEIVALVGESGSGKSTIARTLAGIYKPTTGEILFTGQNISSIGKKELRGNMPMVFQDPFASINPVYRVGHGIDRTLKLHRPELNKNQRKDAAVDLLEKVGLIPGVEIINRYPHELSGGQRQRLGFAQSLASKPKLILADEPVSMLDVSIRIGLLNLMRNLRDQEKVSILYITHDLASARYIADRMIVLYAGQIVEEGPSEDIVKNPKHPYTKLLMQTAPQSREQIANFGSNTNDMGEPPKVIDPKPGCRFSNRCPVAISKCQDEDPQLKSIDAFRKLSCFVES